MRQDAFFNMVGMARLERATLWSQTRYATRLRYIPNFLMKNPATTAAGISCKSGAKEEA